MKKILTTLFVTLGSLLSQAQFSNYQWHQVIGGAGNEQIKCMKADASGNVYLAGYLKSNCLGTVSMPYSGFSGSSYSDGFIVKLNSNSTVAWSKTFPVVNSGGVIQMQAITVSTSGEVYFAGVVYGGDADIDPGASQTIISAPTVSQGFIGKLDASGNYVWGGGISNVESFCNILLTPQGEVAYAGTYTSGSTNVTSNFPVDYNISASNTSYAHTYRIGPFIVKYTPSGSYVHTLIESNGGALYEPGLVSDAYLRDVTMNSAGEFYITGTKYVYSFGTLATRKMYYQKVPTNYVQGLGSWVFPNTGQVGLNANELGYKNAYACGITCDANDNIYISGFFNGGSSDPLDFDPSAATSNQFTD